MGTFNLTSAGGSYDVFVSTLDTSGNFVSARQLGGVRPAKGYGIALDSSGNLFTTGYFTEPADFDPGPGVFELTSPGFEDQHVFVSKLPPPAAPPDTTGAHIISATFSGATTGTFDKVRLVFSEPIDPGSFSVDVIGTAASPGTVTGPNGSIPVTGHDHLPGALDTWDVSFAPQSIPGEYAIRLRIGIIDLATNLMDTNQNGINGEAGDVPGGDQFIGTATLIAAIDVTGPHIVSAVFSGEIAGTFDKARLTFSEAIPHATFTHEDIGNFFNPVSGNPIQVTTVTPVPGTNNQFDVIFPRQSDPGTYSFTTSVFIEDFSANFMDQNQDGVNGQIGVSPAGDQFTASATLTGGGADVTGPHVVSAVFSGAIAGTFDRIRVTFSEPLHSINGFGVADVQSVAGPSGVISGVDVTPVAGTSLTVFDVTFPPQTTAGT